MDAVGEREIGDGWLGDVPREHADRFLTLGDLEAVNARGLVRGEALVMRSEGRIDRTGRAYVVLTLRGVDGSTFEGRWWRFPYPDEHRPAAGSAYVFTGTMETYQGTRQMCISDAQRTSGSDLALYERATRRPLDELLAELRTVIAGLEPDLEALVEAVLSGEVRERYCEWPAAQMKHGAVRYGLLAHSVRVAAMARQLSLAYGAAGIAHDAGIVAAACLLHDVGKVHTLPAIAGSAPPADAERFDHVTLGVLMVRAVAEQLRPRMTEERLNALLHALLAHHGRKDWGAPIEPQTAEAWLVHLADLAESRLWAWSGDAPGV